MSSLESKTALDHSLLASNEEEEECLRGQALSPGERGLVGGTTEIRWRPGPWRLPTNVDEVVVVSEDCRVTYTCTVDIASDARREQRDSDA